MTDIKKIINECSNRIALAHAEIIENECKKACEKFNVTSKDLIMEYSSNLSIKILIKVSEFQITNTFTCADGKFL